MPSAAELPSPQLIERYGTGLDPYALTSAEWLPHAPIALNRDFDFATAMAIDDVGPGLAAAKRIRDNRQSAAETADLQLPTATLAKLDAQRKAGVHVYGLLWGPPDAVVLRIIADRFDNTATLHAHAVSESSPRPLSGEGGWATDRAAVSERFEALIATLPDALTPWPPPSNEAQSAPHQAANDVGANDVGASGEQGTPAPQAP